MILLFVIQVLARDYKMKVVDSEMTETMRFDALGTIKTIWDQSKANETLQSLSSKIHSNWRGKYGSNWNTFIGRSFVYSVHRVRGDFIIVNVNDGNANVLMWKIGGHEHIKIKNKT